MRPTLAILSTWQEICGIAHYTWFLKRALESRFDVTVLPTPRSILMADNDPAEIEQAEKHIEWLVSELKNYDYVNIQFEPGVFARRRTQSLRRVERIINAANNLSVTFHFVDRRDPILARRYLPDLARMRVGSTGVALWRDWTRNRDWTRLYKVLRKKAETNQVTAITHTQRDASLLRGALPEIPVADTPLTFIDEPYRASMRERAKTSRLAKILPPADPTKRYVGLFGFVSEYKGFDAAIETMSHLPDEYEMLAFASVHESTLGVGQGASPYLQKLVSMIKQKDRTSERKTGVSGSKPRRPLAERIHFLGAVNDDDLILGMMLCDAVLFPYLNSNHTASGPISLALETDRYVLASRNIAFVQYSKYFPDAFEFCDIGNPFEMSEKIMLSKRFIESEEEVAGMRWVHFPRIARPFDAVTTAEIYSKTMGIDEERPELRVAAE